MKKAGFPLYLLVLAVMFAFCTETLAQQSEAPQQKLVVGTKVTPPFVLKTAEGGWTGISIELWQRMAADLGYRYELREKDLKGLVDGVTDGSLDVVVAALTITPEREKRLDFSHPIHTAGLGIAVSANPGSPWSSIVGKVFSFAFIKAVMALAALLLAVGLAVWAFERRKNESQFGGSIGNGIWTSFWWSAVTMTTVGYGDKSPMTVGGRVVAIAWMFAAILLISSFTAAIASALTVSQLDTPVKGPEDLPQVRVGTVRETASASYMEEKRISFRDFDTTESGLAALAKGELDAFVYDAPILKYVVNRDHSQNLTVLPRTFLRQDFGFAFPPESRLREPVNHSLLKIIREDEWQDTLYRYLGQ